jgi:hypothetical protein
MMNGAVSPSTRTHPCDDPEALAGAFEQGLVGFGFLLVNSKYALLKAAGSLF